MATFQVPQFIEEKAKIIGPLTLPQFLYIAAAAALILGAFYIFNFLFWLMFAIVISAIGLAFAFVRINGQSLPQIALAAIGFFWKPRIYTWQRGFAEKKAGPSDLGKIEKIREKAGFGEKIKGVALGVLTRKLPSIRINEEKEKYQVVTFMSGEKRVAKKVDY